MELKSRRLGWFRIQRPLIDRVVEGQCSYLAAWHALFSKCVVVEVKHHYISDSIDYYVYCEELDEVPEFCEAPQYTVTFSKHEGFVGAQRIETHDATFQRVK